MKYIFVILSTLVLFIFSTFLTAQNLNSNSDSFVISIVGSPRVQHASQIITVPLSLGSWVKEDDFVELDVRERVQILCSDLSIRTLTSSGGIGCSANSGEQILKYGEFDVMVETSRADNNWLELPYILSPRASKIAGNQVGLVYWAKVIYIENDQPANVTYDLILREVNTGQIVTNVSGIVDTSYTLNKELSLGDYVIEVIAYNDKGRKISSSVDDPEIGLGLAFTVMSVEQQNQLEATVNKILKLNLNPEMQAYILSIVYSDQGVYREAINLLEKLLPSNLSSLQGIATSPIFYLQLGHYYRKIHLPLEAWNMYNQAVSVAREVNDIASLAEANQGLIYIVPDYMLPEVCKDAISLYSQLGDNMKKDEILMLSKCQ